MTDQINYDRWMNSIKEWDEKNETKTLIAIAPPYNKERTRLANYIRSKGYKVTIVETGSVFTQIQIERKS
jgi:alpha-glucosidase (family GH31 glycosyl hydrolase)